MILLPDINVGNTTLSIQDPYTLNGYVVTKIELRSNYWNGTGCQEIIICNELNQSVCVAYSNLENYFREKMYEFVRVYGNRAQTADRRYAFPDWSRYSFQNYIQELKEQCDEIQDNYYPYCLENNTTHLSRLKNELRRQGRLNSITATATATATSSGTTLYTNTNTYGGNLFSGFSTGRIANFEASNVCYGDTITFHNNGNITVTSTDVKKEYKYIHEYTYKPEYIHHCMPNEDKDTALLLGAEIEVDCGGESEEHAKKVLEIVCGRNSNNITKTNEYKKTIIPVIVQTKLGEILKLKDGYIANTICVYEINNNSIGESINTFVVADGEVKILSNKKDIHDFVVKYEREVNAKELTVDHKDYPMHEVKEDKMYCMHDGSLKAGIEFATMPASLEYHKNKMKYKEMFKYLDENGYKAHDTTTCGLHIHANRKYLGKSTLVQQLTISKILYILEKFNDEICVIARRNNDYSKFVGKNEVNESLDKLYGKYYNTGKRVALNLQHKESIEFRCFRGTLKYETFILTLEFVKNIIDYAKSINIEEIELIQWSDLMNTFSDELKNYYNDRLEKEKKETLAECKMATTDVNRNNSIIGDRTLTLSADAITSARATWANWANTATARTNYPEQTLVAQRLTTVPENEIPRIDLSHMQIDRITSMTFDEIYNNFTSAVNAMIETELSSSTNQNSEDPVIHELKTKISSLKKRIKHSTIPMEKSALQKELNNVQKELKKKKKRIKNNSLTN